MDMCECVAVSPHQPLTEESPPTSSPVRKSLSGHDISRETFYKAIYKELTDEEGECRAISLSHSEGTKSSQCNALITALLLKQTKGEPFSHATYFQDYNM